MNEPEKPQNLDKMLKKSPASNVWAENFKNIWSFLELFKSYKIE